MLKLNIAVAKIRLCRIFYLKLHTNFKINSYGMG
nr:MAG TPA: hypothetical protein [Caudoviricetes sp.]